MDHLPLSDIPMLVSTINFLLRDEIFDNLDQICYKPSVFEDFAKNTELNFEDFAKISQKNFEDRKQQVIFA